MTMRSEMRDALDEVVPSYATPGLPERVVGAVLADKRRRRNNKMLVRLRAPLSMVAALVVIALVTAVLVGGRLIQDWNAFHGTPAGHSQLTPLQQLEARPLTLPYVHSLAECTTGPRDPVTLALGSGPVFLDSTYAGGGWTGWGDYGQVVFFTDAQIAGPILVRARDVVTRAPIVFVGPYADGPVAGTDTLNGKVVIQHSELALSANTAAAATDNTLQQPHRFEWEITAGFPKYSTLSTAWQIDGLGFSETFVGC